MDVKLIQTPDAFGSPEWAELFAVDPHRHIFSSPEWNSLWWDEFGGGKELFVLIFLDPGPVGLAPLMLDRTPEGERLRFVGGDDLTDYLGPLVIDHEHLPAIAESLVEYVDMEIPGWSYFDAKCLPVPFHFADLLVDSADRFDLDYQVEQREITAVMAIAPTYEAYLGALPGRYRHELRRKIRRFEAEAQDARVVSADVETLQEDLQVFFDLHKGSEGLKGKFFKPERATFFSRVAKEFEPKGWLSLDFLEVGGRRVASTFSFRFLNTFYLYNSAYDASLKRLSPGLILVAKLIERAIAHQESFFDFLRGAERYKFELGAEALPLHSVRISRKTDRVSPSFR